MGLRHDRTKPALRGGFCFWERHYLFERTSSKVVFWLALGASAIFLAAFIPIFLMIFGIQIMPAPDWVQRSFWPSNVAGLVAFIVFVAILGRTPDMPRLAEGTKGQTEPPGAVTVILSGMMFAWSFADAAVSLPVFAASLFAGQEVEFTYTVASDHSYSLKYCRSAIDLEHMPLLHSKICGLAPDVQSSFSKGDTIVIGGRGTSIGLIARYVRHP